MSGNASEAGLVASDSDPRSRFGFALSDEDWLTRLRQSVEPEVGLCLGAFELLGEMRRGAQGIVVRARQPHTQRIIALKRLAHGRWSTPEERYRFEREVAAAVALSHPNIVTVYGLEYVQDLPLLAMEWIDGDPIDAWARRGTGGRPRPRPLVLAVFLKVCDAVHHAHQRGVIHRDLKPANILLTGEGEPKILDFGLAKRFDARASAAALTASGEFLGSPAYAAPEQLQGGPEAVDLRTDVYALGVLLFELLTGHLPFDAAAGIVPLFDAIRRGQPPPPSRRDATLAGDLDAIVLKAMAGEREHRYPSVDALAADLRRYLAGEPVEARRGQTGYALRKIIRRYWPALTVAAGFVGVVAVAAVSLSILYARQVRMLQDTAAARDAERDARRSSERVLALLEQLLLRVAEAGRGTDVALRRELLGQAEHMVQRELAGARAAQARAFGAIGRTYQRLALYDEAERCLRSALELNLSLAGTGSLEEAASATHLGDLLQDRSHYPEAERLFRRALDIRMARLGAEHADIAESLHNIGNAYSNRHAFGDALATYRRAYDMRRRLLGDRDARTIASLTAIGLAHANLDELAAAEACFREAVASSEDVLGPEDRDTAGRYVALGKTLHARGALDEAEMYLRKGLAVFRATLGDRHDNVAWAAHRLGMLLLARGRYEEADALLREARDTYRAILGPDDPFVGYVCESLATLLREEGREAEAAEAAAEGARIRLATAPRREDR